MTISRFREMKTISLFTMALLAGCVTIEDRLAKTTTPAEVAQSVADHYVGDVGDDSCCVAVVTPAKTFFGHAGPVTEHSLFRIASLSKIFVHQVVLKLHAEGRIDLDRSVGLSSKLDLPPEYRMVTLRDLLMNRSGLPREFITPWSPADVCRALSSGLWGASLYAPFDNRSGFAKETWIPRWRHSVKTGGTVYSNVGFGLLGTTVEDLAGEHHERLLQVELVEPLGLRDTTFEPGTVHADRLTRACAGQLPWLFPRGHDVPAHGLGDAMWASGGIYSSASDCSRVFAAYWPLLDEQLKAGTLDTLPDDAVFGLLHVKMLSPGYRVLYRTGMIYGGASFVGFDPQTHTVVVVLRNVTSWADLKGFEAMKVLARISGSLENRKMVSWNGLEN